MDLLDEIVEAFGLTGHTIPPYVRMLLRNAIARDRRRFATTLEGRLLLWIEKHPGQRLENCSFVRDFPYCTPHEVQYVLRRLVQTNRIKFTPEGLDYFALVTE